MTVHIALAPEEEAKLRESAARLGQDLQTFVRQAALEKADRPSLSELLAPIHDDIRRRRITVAQVDEAIDEARRAHQRERVGHDSTGTPRPND